MKKYKYVFVIIFVVFALIFALVLRGYRLDNQSLPTNLGELKCLYPVVVSGQSMEPALKSGTRLLLSKCFKDKQNLPVGTIVFFQDNGVNKLGRIKEKIILEEGVFYKIGRDARPGEEFTISPDQITASDEK